MGSFFRWEVQPVVWETHPNQHDEDEELGRARGSRHRGLTALTTAQILSVPDQYCESIGVLRITYYEKASVFSLFHKWARVSKSSSSNKGPRRFPRSKPNL